MYLVTGGAGFIGSNIVESLLHGGHQVRVLDDFSTGKKKNIEPLKDKYSSLLDVIEGSICSKEDCKKALKGVRYVSHHAAIPSVTRSVDNPIETNGTNINGTLQLLESIRNTDSIEKVIFAASSSAYGDLDVEKKVEDLLPHPKSPYAVQKLTCEHYVKIYWELFKVPTLAFRYFNIFGPRQDPNSPYSAVIPKFITSFIKGEEPIIYGDGEQSRDFTFVDNVIDANKKGFKSQVCGEVVNIACGTSMSLNELVKVLQSIFKSNIKAKHAQARPGDVKHSLADISKAKQKITYEPKVSIRDGLEKTVEWFLNNKE